MAKYTYKKQLLAKSFTISPIVALLLSACTAPTSSNSSINPYETPYKPTLNNIQEQNTIYPVEGLEAPDPHKCTDGGESDYDCKIQYINDRSFSISNSTFDGKTPSGGWGTAWFLDREVNTNNFYVATNIHVINTIKDSSKIDDENFVAPELTQVTIAHETYDKKTKNYNTLPITPNYYQEISGYNQATHADSDHRILVDVEVPEYKPETDKPKYALAFNASRANIFKLLEEYRTALATDKGALYSKSDILAEAFLQPYLNGNYRNQSSFVSRMVNDDTTFNPDDYVNAKEDNPTLGLEGDLKALLHMNDGSQSKLNAGTSKKYIDAAVIKITIPDLFLQNNFPYLLNPQKYNKWTFPNLATKNPWKITDEQKKDTDQNLTFNSDQTFTLWHAGYPVEQLNRNLTYLSKNGPIFKSSEDKVVGLNFSNDTRTLDHFPGNLVPMGAYSYVFETTYDTGGGSSGSMMIDKDYNVAAIYWGARRNGAALYTEFVSHGLANPLFSDDENSVLSGSKPLYDENGAEVFYRASEASASTEEKQLYKWYKYIFQQKMLDNYAQHRSKSLLDQYKAVKSQWNTNNGLDFSDLAKLNEGLVQLDKNEKTGSAQVLPAGTSELTDAQMQSKMHEAINKGLKDQATTINGYFTNWNQLLTTAPSTPSTWTGVVIYTNNATGTVNLKNQMQEFLKKKQIQTYSLNPTSK